MVLISRNLLLFQFWCKLNTAFIWFIFNLYFFQPYQYWHERETVVAFIIIFVSLYYAMNVMAKVKSTFQIWIVQNRFFLLFFCKSPEDICRIDCAIFKKWIPYFASILSDTRLHGPYMVGNWECLAYDQCSVINFLAWRTGKLSEMGKLLTFYNTALGRKWSFTKVISMIHLLQLKKPENMP